MNKPRLLEREGSAVFLSLLLTHTYQKHQNRGTDPRRLGVLLLRPVLFQYGVSDGPSLSTMLSEILGKDLFFHLSSVKQISMEKMKNPYLCPLGQKR